MDFTKNEVLVLCNVQNGYKNKETECYFERIKKLVETVDFKTIIVLRDIRSKEDATVPEWLLEKENVTVFNTCCYNNSHSISRLFNEPLSQVFIAGFNTEDTVLATVFGLHDIGVVPYVLMGYTYSVNGLNSHMDGVRVIKSVFREEFIVWSKNKSKFPFDV